MGIKYSYTAYRNNDRATSISHSKALSGWFIFLGAFAIIGGVAGVIEGNPSFPNENLYFILGGVVLFGISLYTRLTADKRIRKALKLDQFHSQEEVYARLRQNREIALKYLKMDFESQEFISASTVNNCTPEYFVQKCEIAAQTGLVDGTYALLK